MREGKCYDLGLRPYGETHALQEAVHARQVAGRTGAMLLIVEHPPVVTVGRLSRETHLRTPREQLADRGVEVLRTDRGGQLTYHGPGQLIAYPLVNVTATGLSLHGFVRALEQAVVDTVDEFGVAGARVPEHTGVWVGDEKLCAIGLRIRRWWSLHGLALNVCCDLTPFGWFVPCGIEDRGVTSLSRILGRAVGAAAVKPVLVRHLGLRLGFRWTMSPTEELEAND